MSGVGDNFEFYEMMVSYVNSYDNGTDDFESIMNLNPEWDPDYSHSIFSKNVGYGSINVVGSSFAGYTDDEARILANAVQYGGGFNEFVSFNPESENHTCRRDYRGCGKI